MRRQVSRNRGGALQAAAGSADVAGKSRTFGEKGAKEDEDSGWEG